MEMCIQFCCLGTTDKKKWSCIRVGDIQILEQQQIVMAALTTYGLGFRPADTSANDALLAKLSSPVFRTPTLLCF
jgi:hypothetical protein